MGHRELAGPDTRRAGGTTTLIDSAFSRLEQEGVAPTTGNLADALEDILEGNDADDDWRDELDAWADELDARGDALAADSTKADSLRADAAQLAGGLAADSVSGLRAELDSAMQAAVDFARTQRRDTVIAVHYDASENQEKADTTRNKDGIDAPVEYSAADSLIYDAASGTMFLYGDAKVHYQNMDLNAANIVEVGRA